MTPAMKLSRKKKTLVIRNRGIQNAPRRGPWRCRVREKRLALELTASEVADALGLSKAGLSQIENGGDPMLTTAFRLADFFGVSVDELWEEE